jgi:hypothetical protein
MRLSASLLLYMLCMVGKFYISSFILVDSPLNLVSLVKIYRKNEFSNTFSDKIM